MKNDGGPAFPVPESEYKQPEGMTLRDYFAGQVVGAFYSAIADKMTSADNPHEIATNFAAASYLVADAMLRERAK